MKIVICKLFQFGRVKNFSFGKGLTKQCRVFATLRKKAFDNIAGENAGNQHNVFYHYLVKFQFLSVIYFNCSLQNVINLDQSKTLLFGKE